MRYPEFLKKNGTIGFVAPSFGCNIEPYRSAFENAKRKWKEEGYQLDLGPNCYADEGVGISNTPKKCGEELTEYYVSEKNDCLISCGGGELMCEVLNYVDFEAVRKAKPKWYMGYSDNTNMTFLLTTLCDTASVYGPCASAFGMEPWHPSVTDAFALLKGEKLSFESYGMWEKESLKDEEHPLLPYNCTEPLEIKMFTPDSRGKLQRAEEAVLEGRLLGGCMDCLVNFLGTKFDKVSDFTENYKEDGIIWFLEACDLNVFAIRRAMWQMENAGWFSHVKGFLIGRPLNGDPMMNLDHLDAVLAIAEKYRVPVIMDADLGHLSPTMPLITGSMAKIEGRDGRIKVSMMLK
ncbi:MAG: S66 peptidase family protein [Suilimivivens sp.]